MDQVEGDTVGAPTVIEVTRFIRCWDEDAVELQRPTTSGREQTYCLVEVVEDVATSFRHSGSPRVGSGARSQRTCGRARRSSADHADSPIA
jgi:hypothetical protein